MNKQEALSLLGGAVDRVLTERNKTATQFARELGLSFEAVSRTRRGLRIPCREILDVLLPHLDLDEDVEIAIKVYSSVASRSTPGGAANVPSPAVPPKMDKCDDTKQIRHDTKATTRDQADLIGALNSVSNAIADRVLAQLLISGAIPVGETSPTTGLRFLLTRRSFREVRDSFRNSEIDDTRLMIEELRRRLAILYEMPQSAREDALRKLIPELDLLVLALQHARDKIPVRGLENIEFQQQLLARGKEKETK